jgi:hypothetical protein
MSANGGVIRWHDAESGLIAQRFVDETFAQVGVAADVFAFDWRARQFAVTRHMDEDGAITRDPQEPVVVALDPFDMTATAWVPLPLFERVLGTDLAESALDPGLFDRWRRANGLTDLPLTTCAGTTVPAFYGATLTVENMTVDTLEVYLSFTAQLWAHAREEPPGGPAPILRVED